MLKEEGRAIVLMYGISLKLRKLRSPKEGMLKEEGRAIVLMYGTMLFPPPLTSLLSEIVLAKASNFDLRKKEC